MAYAPKRFIDSNSVGKELKRLHSDKKATFVAAIATANGSDPATTQALANQTKTTVNAIQAALVAAGIMAAS